MTAETRLTIPEVKDRLRCSEWSVYRLIRSGDLLGAKVAGRWLVSEAAVAGYLQDQERAANPDAAPYRKRRKRRAS